MPGAYFIALLMATKLYSQMFDTFNAGIGENHHIFQMPTNQHRVKNQIVHVQREGICLFPAALKQPLTPYSPNPGHRQPPFWHICSGFGQQVDFCMSAVVNFKLWRKFANMVSDGFPQPYIKCKLVECE